MADSSDAYHQYMITSAAACRMILELRHQSEQALSFMHVKKLYRPKQAVQHPFERKPSGIGALDSPLSPRWKLPSKVDLRDKGDDFSDKGDEPSSRQVPGIFVIGGSPTASRTDA